MTFKNRGRLLKLCEHSGRVGGVLLRLTLKRLQFRWLQCESPVEINTPKARFLLKESEPVIHENLCDGIAVLLLTRQLETRHDAGVLVETGAFGKAAQRAFNRPHPGVKLLVSQTLFIYAGQRKQASVAAALESEDA